MAAFDAEVVERKILLMRDYLKDLEKVKDFSLEEYQADIFRKRGIEKTIVNVVQCAVDINNYLLARLFTTAPSDNYDSFIKLGEKGVVPTDLAKKLAPSAGLRSRLIHEYAAIDDRIVHASMEDALEQFPEYVRHIKEYLQALEG
jgi:uncharacterized protein YutE (UPF0331/DUF86 family)